MDRFILPIVWFWVVAVAQSGDAGPLRLPDEAVVQLELDGALAVSGVSSADGRRDFSLHLTRKHGRWDSYVWGFARRYNQSVHEGSLRVVQESDEATRLHVEMLVLDDPWVEGGFATYDIELHADDVDRIAGRHTGWFNGVDVRGDVSGRVTPTPRHAAVVSPLDPGEHPRLMFRRARIPALCAHATTDWGARLLTALRARLAAPAGPRDDGLDRAIGHGLLYVLFGEQTDADAAVQAIRPRIWNLSGSGGHAHDVARGLLSLALACDLVHDQLTPHDLALLAKQLTTAGGIVTQRQGLHGNWNNGPNSNWTAIGVGGAGMAALVMLRERGQFGLDAPTPCPRAEAFDAAPDAVTASDAATWVFSPGTLVTNWLYAGPIEPVAGQSPLDALGDPAHRTPAVGDAFTYAGRRVAFAPLPAAAVGSPMLDFLGALPAGLMLPDATPTSVTYLYTTVHADGPAEGILRCLHPADFRGARVWIDGRPVAEGTGVRLAADRHHLLMEVTGPVVRPRFDAAAVGPMLGKWRRFEALQARYERARQVYEETGERQDPPVLLAILRRHAAAWATHALGDHGWKTETEGYQFISLAMLLPFAAAYANVTGDPLADGTGLDWVLPLALARGCASGGGGYGGRGALGLSPEFLAWGLRLSAPALRPALAWELQRRVADDVARGNMDCRTLVSVFVNYPMDIAARPPAEIMPKVVVDGRKGAYVWRDGYRGPDDIVTQMFLQTEAPRGPAWFLREAGSFRIGGLGTAWAVGGGQGKREKEYEKENVVIVAPNTGAGLGRTLYYDASVPGVYVLGGDLGGFHNTPTNDSIQATRHFAVDYSGRAGVPALFAVVDRVKSGGTKCWTLHTGGKATAITAASENGAGAFMLAGTQPDTSLYGLIVSPPDARLVVTNNTVEIHSRADTVDYFVVMTLQRGAAPHPGVEGDGLASRVRVGERRIRFGDGKLILE